MTPHDDKADKPNTQACLNPATAMIKWHLERDEPASVAHWEREARRLGLILRKEAREAALVERLHQRFGGR